jgi:hypothetical protein
MLADQFHAAASAARNTASVDELARLTWRAHAEGQLTDVEASSVSEALQAAEPHSRRSGHHRRRGLPLASPGPPAARDRPIVKLRSSGATLGQAMRVRRLPSAMRGPAP